MKKQYENMKADEAKALKGGIHDDIDEDIQANDYSDDEWDMDDEKKDQELGKKLKQEEENKKAVRKYEEEKAKGTLKLTYEENLGGEDALAKHNANLELDQLWSRMRDFFDDVNEVGQKRELKGKDEPSKLKFMKACEEKDTAERGILPLYQVEAALIKAQLTPLVHKSDLLRLFKALEVIDGDSVNYRALLGAPVSREINSLHGIFPKIKQKGPSQKQIEEKKKKELEERKKQEQIERDLQKQKELADKRLEEAKKTLGEQSPTRRLTKEETKMKEREEQLKHEAEKRESLRKQQKETEEVKKEVSEYRKVIDQLQTKIKNSGQNLRNCFSTFDHDKDEYLGKENIKKLLSNFSIFATEKEMDKVFELMDLQQQGKISYNTFCDVIDRSEVLPLDTIVRKRREERGETYLYDNDVEVDALGRTQRINTSFADIASQSKPETRGLGSVDGLSQIMDRSTFDHQEHRQFMDDHDILDNYDKIKEMFKTNAFTFEDVLQKMGKPEVAKENVVTFNDFKKVVLAMPGGSTFSNQQVKSVFMTYAQGGPSESGAYIPLAEFKDKFYPGQHWQRHTAIDESSYLGTRSQHSSAFESRSESMHIDHMLAGKRLDDVRKEQDRVLQEKQLKYTPHGLGRNLGPIKEDKYEMASQSSAPSRHIEDVMGSQNNDPRRGRSNNVSTFGLKDAQGKSFGGNSEQSRLLKEHLENEENYRQNKDYYRQNEVIAKQIPLEERYLFDKSLDIFFKKFCKALIDEISTGPVKRDVASFVDQYGRENKGYLSYQEFKEVYVTHVHEFEKKGAARSEDVEEAKLRALFKIFDDQQLGRISSKEFVKIVLSQQPSNTVIDRLKIKIKKGGERLLQVLKEEFQNQDIAAGYQGQLPLSNFQTIMTDYDLSFLEQDLAELRKQAFVFKDQNLNEFIKYNDLLDFVRPKARVEVGVEGYNKAIIRIQKMWRGHVARKRYRMISKPGEGAIGRQVDQITSGRGVTFKDQKQDTKGKSAKRLTAEEKKQQEEKKKKQVAAQAKEKRKKTETLEARMGQVIKVSKDPKKDERALAIRKEMTEYIKNVIFEQIITAAQAYGESLEIGKEIQKNFEQRPVTKYIFPLVQEFQYNVMGVQPKSLQTLNELGHILFLDSENMLNQYDIPTNKTLQQVNLGTRPPLKHYDIIDMICDQTSGRIYTLNSNWILEIWNIEQSVSLPQKRLAVCTNEGSKDYISLYYKNTFNNAKPRFLSLQDHNQQILVVNTSCVDGCVVFIDPISFSVLKKIQLRYSDYEIQKKIRDAIRHLKEIFKTIIDTTGKSMHDIFADITTKEQNIRIKEFVLKLTYLDRSLTFEQLSEVCQVLDQDGNGYISLDEFLHYFMHSSEEDENEVEAKKAEEEMFENIWPEWVAKEGQIDKAKALLVMMHDHLDQKYGITAEAAFGMNDINDKGLSTVENFQRILNVFFQNILPHQKDVDFVLRLSSKTVDQQIKYREFCRLLDKRFIRKIKNNNQSISDLKSEKGFLNDLDQIVRKEASLNYVIRKASELKLDLRSIFMTNDENKLSVIARNRFYRILESLPLGLLPYEINEIFENDLHFDNYGNVDYTLIVNSDIFVALERQRMRKQQQARDQSLSLSFDMSNIMNQDHSLDVGNEVDKLTDNRKAVVEDLIYLDDLETLIYTTVLPKTSTIFITHTKKTESTAKGAPEVEVITLQTVKTQAQQAKGHKHPQQQEAAELIPNYYQLIARLRGHRNTDPPSLCYVPASGCLVSGEKFLQEVPYKPGGDTLPKSDDPSIPVSHKFQKSTATTYQRHAEREKQSSYKSEILVWNLQRDLIELFQTKPPWTVPVFRRINAHNSSIIDLCYLPKVQLLVSASTDQTIRFFDPVSTSFELTDPNNIPHAQQRPGYYRPLQKESTKGNVTFKEVKRIYTGTDTSCFGLRTLSIQNIHLDAQSSDMKSSIEWLIGLKLGKPSRQGRKNTQVGFICGYGIERVKIEIPAIHHDDLVPPHVMKQCEDLVQTRRRRLVTAFIQQLPYKIEKIYSQVSLQNSYMANIRKLFLEAILQRKDLKYVNAEPLREIYKIILKLPNRTKFENFLATSGCSDKLSVSETFFYLQRFMQIHPLRTTQIEFEKSIEVFQQKHSREFLRGTKRWPNPSIQKFADYIRLNGLDIQFLQRDSFVKDQARPNDFCTRERFIQYFRDTVAVKERFSDEEIEIILNELDPFFTGVIQIVLLQNYYREEIKAYNMATLNRPQKIFSEIRSKIFPNKKLQLQQALTSVDNLGDGYILREQLIEAFLKAEINVDRGLLEFLFDVVAEKYNTNKEQGQTSNDDEKVLSISYFMNKLFSQAETNELYEVDVTLQKIKAALVYKGLEFSIIFAENTVDRAALSKIKRQQSALQKQSLDETAQLQKQKEMPIDLTSHYTNFAQQLVKDEFCQRVQQLNATNATPDQIRRLSNFLSLNQKNNLVIYLNSWLHHLRRVQTQFHLPNKSILPMICSKLLRNETVFRSYVESTADIKNVREAEKIIDVSDLRQVLHKFGVNYINQDIYLNEFTHNEAIHIEDLVTRMKTCVQQAYTAIATTSPNSSNIGGGDTSSSFIGLDASQTEIDTIRDLKKTDYFDRVQMKLKTLQNKISLTDLIDRMRKFDTGDTGKVKIYHFINLLKHNYPTVFDNDMLLGLQFELECINADDCVDYEEFVKIFFEKQASIAKGGDESILPEVKLDRRSTYQIQDFEDLLSRISMHIKPQQLDLMGIFKIFAAKDGSITYDQLRKILELISFSITETEFRLLVNFADDNNDGSINMYEFANQVVYAKELAPQFDINKWIVASRALNGRYQLLEMLYANFDMLKDTLISEQGSNGLHSGVLSGDYFQNLLRDAPNLSLNEYDIDLITIFAIKGSKRASVGVKADQASHHVNTKNDLIQFYNLEKSLVQVIAHLKKEDDNVRKQGYQEDQFEDEMVRFRRELDRREKEQLERKNVDPIQRAREQQLVNKIIELFVERDVTFFDCFHHSYDPLNPQKSIVTISQFKKSVNSLNLPLTVQENRILRRIADPLQIGKVDLQKFCTKFETEELRKRRLNSILEKVATAFFLQNFNLRRAFALFDKDGDGQISKKEFRQGWLALGLGLTYDEIDDLMNLVDVDKSGHVSYDEFLSKMDIHIQRKSKQAADSSREIVFHKLKSLMDNNSDTLVNIMSHYDHTNQGAINKQDMVRAFKRLGILHPEQQLDMLLQAGKLHESTELIDYVEYSRNLQKSIDKALGLNISKAQGHLQKIYQILQAKKQSVFEFFCQLDVNFSGAVSKLEFKTGIQAMGINPPQKEFEQMWLMIKKSVRQIKGAADPGGTKAKPLARGSHSEGEEPDSQNLSYYELINAFIKANCLKLQKSVDNINNLLNKFRQQLKKKNLSVEKAYKQYDPEDRKFVFRHDFINETILMGLEFSDEELDKIFDFICQVGTSGTTSKDQQKQLQERKTQKSTTRFTFKQLHDAVLVKRDENWLFQSFIKIHGLVLQKNLSYKRLFNQWREKNSKTQVGRLSQKELKIGLKKLRAGLNSDEVEKLCSSVPFEGKDNSIAAADFERIVVQGAKKLELEKSYEKLLIQEWITYFNECLNKENIPLEKIFSENDTEHKGSLGFVEFNQMNEFLGISTSKKDLKRIFDLIDRSKSGRVRLDEIKGVSQLISNESDGEDFAEDDEEHAKQGLNSDELKIRHELDDLYSEVKDKLEKKNITLESLIYEQLKYMPNQFANTKGIQQVFERLQIVLSKNEVEHLLGDVRKSFQGRYECSFKDFIDFMTRKRINVAFFDKGFVDPLIAHCCQTLNKTIRLFDLTIEKAFGVFDNEKGGLLTKTVFMKCIQGMELGISIEDLLEFFNYIDDRNENTITKIQFVDAITFVTSKIGGGSKLEQALSSGTQLTKKGNSVRQQVFNILKKLSDAIQAKRFTMRQVIALFDVNKAGFISRGEFAGVIKSMEAGIQLDETRTLMNFFDDKNGGKISIVDLVKAIQEIMNNQAGGGVYAFMQIQPILQKIVNELAIDCDKFFDEVAELNEQMFDEEQKAFNQTQGLKKRIKRQTRSQVVGLNKRLFFQHLAKYGVQLDEDEKTLLNTVFVMPETPEKFDYERLDIAFEGVQQQLYAQDAFYTVEWERRIFKKIGEYLKRNNLTIHKCFNMIDEDNSQTISMDELRDAVIRFQLSITDKELKVFLQRLDEDKKGYVTQAQFIQKFWSAYTYDDVFADEDNIHGKSKGQAAVSGSLSEKMRKIKMFNAIQKKIKLTCTCKEAFQRLDTGIGFLTLKDFQSGLSRKFDITLKRDEVLKLFKEVDIDRDGLVKFREFEDYYNYDYQRRMVEIEKQKEKASIQFEIFDHMMKVLQQKSLTLSEVFDQIDSNKNGFIECDEFQNLLERLGFTISEQQVYELMRQMDENFDGRISYNELKEHINSLGFKLNQSQLVGKKEGASGNFVWRDKGLEVAIRALHSRADKTSFEEFFKQFDSDHDNYLTPAEFRSAFVSLKGSQLKRFQIERILHILVDEKKATAVVSIPKMAKFFKSYSYLDKSEESQGQAAVLINEDLFVYVVEKYDGFSRLVEQTQVLFDKSTYIQRHVYELGLRGLNMLSNQKTIQKLHKKNLKLNELFESALILLAGEANRLMKEEAQLCVLDPTYNINTIVNDQNLGVLNSIQVPLIENSAFDIDFTTLQYLPSGAQQYQGFIPETGQKVEILIYPNEDLNYVSLDGKTYKKHLQLELQVHRYLMGAQFEEEEELDSSKMDIFANLGKFEKKIGLAASDKEIYVVNELIDLDQWISLEDFVLKNGGILNIPLFYHTDAPLFIVRYWAQKLLQIVQKLHDVSIVLRCLDLKQVYISRDGQRMKLSNLRGLGRVNNLGNIQSCPDIYLTLEHNSLDDRYGQSSTMSPGYKAGASSKKTEAQKTFSNRALDDPFIAPEHLFMKFSEHTSALDVWSFGMIMYCVLLGQKPDSFYSIYRGWYKKHHGHDIELGTLPFIPPSKSNFLYDPFSIDFDNPFRADEQELNQDLNLPGSLMEKQSTLNFENCMKCIKDLSCSSLFADGNSKKFAFKTVAKDIRDNDNPQMLKDQAPRFPGQSHTNTELRRKMFQAFAKAEVLDRKNELGLILDIIASCLDMDPTKRPTISGLINSPLFKLDNYELTNAVRFSQNVILYRSPQSAVSLRITTPLRSMCAIAIKSPSVLFDIENDLLKMFQFTEECIGHISTLPIDQINSVLTEDEKRRSLLKGSYASSMQGKDFSSLRVSPNSPLAAQVIEDKVIDMLIFLTLRYLKGFQEWKGKKIVEIEKDTASIIKHQQSVSMSIGSKKKSVKFSATDNAERQSQYQNLNQQTLLKKQTERLQNYILSKMCGLLKTLVYEMHSYNTPMSPFVKQVLDFVVKFYVGEEYDLGSDQVLRKTSGADNSIKDYLRQRSFLRRETELNEDFKSDQTDKLWHTEQKNKTFLDKSNYWSVELHKEALKIYKDAITESGKGQSCYPVINDYITNVNNSFEPSKVFSRQMNSLCSSFLIPMNRTAAYYDELVPLTECLARLYSPELEKAGKRCSLAVIRSVFQTGNSDKIKACLDMRVPKHIIHFLQDNDNEVRHECLLIFYEISKGLQDDDFEIIGKYAANLKQELSKQSHSASAFDQHKTISLMAQQQQIVPSLTQQSTLSPPQLGEEGVSTKKKRTSQPQQSQADMMSSYIKRTTALIEKNDNDKYINFAMDLPNLNFLSNKRFLKEMAICFESPVFIAPLIRLLKSPAESFANRETILQILANLFCGNEKVLIAINSPACDTYMTLLRMLMQNTKMQSAKASASGLSAQMKQQIALQGKVVDLFNYMFQQRRPTIIRDLSCIGASSTLLKEQGLSIPSLINLPEIIGFVDNLNEFAQHQELQPQHIIVEDFISMLQDLRCWIKHFYQESQIPELTRIKAIQRCVNLIVKVAGITWRDFEHSPERRAEYLTLIKASFSIIDWLCVRDQEQFIFNEQNGKYNLDFIIDKCNYALSAFRHPPESQRVPMEDLAHNKKANKAIQQGRKYDIFPFTEIGAILQNILYQLVRKNNSFTNQLLSEANFGFIFGEQLILEYDFIRHCIDNKIESMVLIDTYVKKNEIRQNTFESLLRNSEHTLKHQFISSNFFEKMFADYINDFREFNIQFSKIDLEFLAFRKTYPVRLEQVSLLNTVLINKDRAPSLFTEAIMYAKRHNLIKNETNMLRMGKVSNEESTSLLLFSIILESNEQDLIMPMMQEGVHKVIRDMMKEYPSLNKRFPILARFTNKF